MKRYHCWDPHHETAICTRPPGEVAVQVRVTVRLVPEYTTQVIE